MTTSVADCVRPFAAPTTVAPVTVVIPAFNCGRSVTQAIESVLAQTLPPAEVVVVDDGSTDDTRQQLEPYLDRVRYLHQTNQGVSAARNCGVQAAAQKFVAFLDADDVWHPRKLELQMGVFDFRPELGLIGTREFDWPAIKFPILSAACPVRDVTWSELVVKNRLNTSSVVVRRAVLEQAGPFDTGLQGPEDRDLWLRVAELVPVANLELPLMGYRDVPASVSKQAARCKSGMLRILQKQDERGTWRGRRLLRRKAYGFVYHSSAFLFGEAGEYREALRNSLKSVLWYPFPYTSDVGLVQGERPRRLIVNLLRWAGLIPRPAPPQPTFEDDRLDALQRLLQDRYPAAVGGAP